MKAVFTFSLLILLVTACSKATEDRIQFPELKFTVNPELLDTTVARESGIEFLAPKGYILLPDSVVALLKSEINKIQETGVPSYMPISAYLNIENPGMFIIISSVVNDSGKSGSFADFAFNYDARYRSFYPSAETTAFTVNGIRCWQSRLVEKGLVRFRLALDAPSPEGFLQIDFSFPNTPDGNWGRVIESALGAIKKQY